jgi:HEAT repeat protein
MYAACQEPDVGALVEKLGSKDWKVSYDAIKKLQNIEGPAVPALIKALKRPEEQIRANAAICLWGFGVETGNPAAQPAVPHLISLAEKDPSAKVRWHATSAVVRLGATEAAVPVLIQAVEKDNHSYAAQGLGWLGPKAKAAVPALMAAAKKREGVPEQNAGWDLRWRAVEALAAIKHDPEVLVPFYCELLDDPKNTGDHPADKPVKAAAYEGLASLGPQAKAAIPTLIKHLKGKRDPLIFPKLAAIDLRIMAALALAEVDPGNRLALSAVLELGKEKELSSTRAVACNFVGKFGDTSDPVITFLTETIENNEEEFFIRRAAEDALDALKAKLKKGQK